MKPIESYNPKHPARTKAYKYNFYLGMSEFILLRYNYAMFLGCPVSTDSGVTVYFKTRRAMMSAKVNAWETLCKSIVQKVAGFEVITNPTII